ncbi:cytochrome P450 [Ganoderma sinense ZZ0214-1]|uniref:Cytochrome P450 n=1 Tax=Ganoderma sinense ZZ0214-1 TaxID=1077348 RepID=A0A2G8RQ41_9APHY|nr:cytochrome P450 [Ganoderma sinense ZZ0214-1]
MHKFCLKGHQYRTFTLPAQNPGYEHQRQRKRVQPAFSTRFVRSTTPTLNQVAQEVLVDVLRGEAQEKAMEVDISDYLGRYSLESIGRATMGCSFGPLNRHGTEYSRAMKRFGPAMVKLHLGRRFLPWLTKTFPPYLLNLASELVPWRALREMKALSNTLHTASKLVLAQRLEDLQRANEDMYDGGGGKDLMTFLLKENATSSDIDTLSDSDLLGQMSLMLLAGTDTTSTTISRVLEMLATHRDVQNELRRELEQATTGAGRSLADMDNDSFAELRFLNAVVKETLRLNPPPYPANHYPYSADKDIPLPLGTPITGLDGRPIHEVVVPAGTTVLVNILGVNRDPGIWGPDASEWKPARWLSPLPTSVSEAHVPSVFSNTGYQLAVTKIRIAVAHLVLAFDFTPSDKEIEWKWQGITTPTVRGSPSKKQELPIILTPTKLIS